MIFCMGLKIKAFHKLTVLPLLVIPIYAQSTQNNMLVISLQYLKEEFIYEVDGLHADKYENHLQIDTIILIGLDRYAQNTQASLQFLYDILRKKLRMNLATLPHLLVQILLLRYTIHPMFSHP